MSEFAWIVTPGHGVDLQRWQSNPVCRLHWQRWESDYLLFNAAAGQTHLLNELGAEILKLLETQPLSREDVGKRLVEQYDDLILDSKLQQAIDAMLEELDGLGLIEPCWA